MCTCHQRCRDNLHCPFHRKPAYHKFPGRLAVLVEDCSQDLPFSLHLPLRKVTPPEENHPNEHVRALVEELNQSLAKEGQSSSSGAEQIYHLVQQEDVILKIHAEELPPDEYYDGLAEVL